MIRFGEEIVKQYRSLYYLTFNHFPNHMSNFYNNFGRDTNNMLVIFLGHDLTDLPGISLSIIFFRLRNAQHAIQVFR